MSENQKGFKCDGCKKITFHFYMLKDEIWTKISKSKKIDLCLECVEKRLGRTLEKSDFADVPLNYIMFILPIWKAKKEDRKIVFTYWKSILTSWITGGE